MVNNDIVPGFDDEKNESLKIKLREAPDAEACLVLTLHGQIDTYNSNYFQKVIGKVIEAGYVRLIFNCGGLNYVSSTGIGSFSAFQKAVKSKGGDIVLFEVRKKVLHVFQILGLAEFIIIRDSFESSIGFFLKGASPENAPVFPKTFSCPICSNELKVLKPGRSRCSGCQTPLAVDYTGRVSLG